MTQLRILTNGIPAVVLSDIILYDITNARLPYD